MKPSRVQSVVSVEFILTVEGDYYPGHPGTMYQRNGDPGDPPEAPEYDIDGSSVVIEDENGTAIPNVPPEVKAWLLSQAEDAIAESASNVYEGGRR